MNKDTAQGTIRTVLPGIPVRADGNRHVRLDDLGDDGVVEVETDAHGTIAVGVADGTPFAMSNICRHQGAKLGRGQIREGCLECPWHRARYDVRTGAMVRGPQGRIFGFPPYSWFIRALGNTALHIRTFPVELRDGWIELAG
jgi:nitrite reductase/ring-hydroxylating ferredoxin subunit